MNEGEIGGPVALPVDPTGVRGLDVVLGGGLPRRALALVSGPPGSGKTTLAAQLAVAAARAGRRALIVTAFAESTDKLIAHLRTYRFFDADLLGAGLDILSLGQFLDAGMARLAEEVIGLVRDRRAQLVVLDGFDGVRGIDPDPQVARRLLYAVGNAAAALGATTLVTSVADPRDITFAPQATVADVIVRLGYDLVGMRERRRLEVVKIRGAAPLPGLHALTLGADGAAVYPRLESRVAVARRRGEPAGMRASVNDAGEMAPSPETPVAFGLPALDTLVAGGFAGTTLLAGEVGTGKTLLGLQFALAGVARGEPAVLLSFRESRRELQRLADAFALGPRLRAALRPGGGLTLLDVDVPPVELDADVVADELLDVLDEMKARRLVVDSSADLERAVAVSGGVDRVDDYMGAFTVALRTRDVSALFVKESSIARPGAIAADGLAPRVDNVLLLQQEAPDGRSRREFVILKTRFAAHDTARYPYAIVAPMGIVLEDLGDEAGGESERLDSTEAGRP